jgi:hypothetical protein
LGAGSRRSACATLLDLKDGVLISVISAFFVLTRIFANPLSNVFQKKLTKRAADPLWIIFVTHLLLSLACLPVFWLLQPLNLDDSSESAYFCPSLTAVQKLAGLIEPKNKIQNPPAVLPPVWMARESTASRKIQAPPSS